MSGSSDANKILNEASPNGIDSSLLGGKKTSKSPVLHAMIDKAREELVREKSKEHVNMEQLRKSRNAPSNTSDNDSASHFDPEQFLMDEFDVQFTLPPPTHLRSSGSFATTPTNGGATQEEGANDSSLRMSGETISIEDVESSPVAGVPQLNFESVQIGSETYQRQQLFILFMIHKYSLQHEFTQEQFSQLQQHLCDNGILTLPKARRFDSCTMASEESAGRISR